MEDKKGSGSKPLRSTTNKFKDIYNTYMKQGDRVIPIKEAAPDSKVEKEEEMPVQELHAEEQAEEIVETETETEPGTEKEIEVEPEAETEETEEMVLDESVLIEIQEKITELLEERDELKDKLLRTNAEMENLRRRTNKEKQEMMEYGNEKVLFKMLELMDDMGNAIDAAKNSDDFDALLSGIELINQKAIKIFSESGVTRMEDPVGKPFDVDFHEAMMHIPSAEQPEGNVVQEFQAGYMIRDRVLRHAKVITSSGAPEEEDK